MAAVVSKLICAALATTLTADSNMSMTPTGGAPAWTGVSAGTAVAVDDATKVTYPWNGVSFSQVLELSVFSDQTGGKSAKGTIPIGAQVTKIQVRLKGTLNASASAVGGDTIVSVGFTDGTRFTTNVNLIVNEYDTGAGTSLPFDDTLDGGMMGLTTTAWVAMLRSGTLKAKVILQDVLNSDAIFELGLLEVWVTWTYPSFESVPLVAASPGGARTIARAIKGWDRLLICEIGDSNRTMAAAGGMAQAALNLHTLPLMMAALDFSNPYAATVDGQTYLWNSGWHMTQAMSGTNWTAQLPVYMTRSGGTSLNAEAAYTGLTDAGEAGFCQSLPAGCNDIQSPSPLGSSTLYVNATAGNGLFMTLQANAGNGPAEFPWAVGSGVRLWEQAEDNTYLIVANVKCSTSGFAKEIQLINYPQNQLYAAVGPSATQTIKSAAGGVTALNLNTAALVTSDDANGRATPAFGVYGPLTWKTSSVVKDSIQVTGLGLASDGTTIAKAIWAGFGFVSSRGTGIGWATLAAHGSYSAHHHTIRHPYCQPFYRGFRDAHLTVNANTKFAVKLQVGVNSGYVLDPIRGTYSSADEYVADMVEQYQFLVDAFQNPTLPVLLEAPPRHDNSEAGNAAGASADSKDPEYHRFAYALWKAASDGRFGPNWTFFNGTRLHDAMGLNRSENLINFGTATGTGVFTSTTAFTQSGATYNFHAGLVGRKIVIEGTGTFVVAGFTSATVITLTGNATCSGKRFCFLPAMTSGANQACVYAAWDAAASYIPGDIVEVPGGGGPVECRTAHTNIHPIGSSSGPANWKPARRRYFSVGSDSTPDGSHFDPTGYFAQCKASVDSLPMIAALAGGQQPSTLHVGPSTGL